jgi:hypothetical protein
MSQKQPFSKNIDLAKISPDDPLRLDVAAALAFPTGP